MSQTVHIGLLFNYTYSFYRNVLRGVRRFAETRPNWSFLPVGVNRGHLSWHGKVEPEGLLTTLNSEAFFKAVGDWHRPIVNVSSGVF